jgi:hypothetical protein
LKKLAVVAFTVLSVGLVSSPAWASSYSASRGATYHSKHITFKYPSNWSQLPKTTAATFGHPLASSGYVTISALAGVETVNLSNKHVAVAILAKMTFLKSFQKKLKGNEALFLKKFEQGVKGSSNKVLSVTTARFAGMNADEIQVLLKSGGTKTHDAFFIAIPKGSKTVDMAIMVTSPSSAWNTYSSAIKSIAASSSFH